MSWQKKARFAVAIFGIVFAGVVFFAIGEREKPAAAPAPERLDPSAVIETSQGQLHRVTGTRQDFTVSFERQLTYEDGRSRLTGVRIEVKERQGRDFIIAGGEAIANEKSREIELSRNVTLTASDGFELTTESATFRESDGLVRAAGPVTFARGPMSGGGVGMTYDKNADVLGITSDAHVTMRAAAGGVAGEFRAGEATLDRQANFLALRGTMHAVRGEQTIDADEAIARLTENEEAVTAIELRGNARVAGGSSAFEAMTARDIDLAYAGDGETLERVTMNGAGTIALRGQSGTAGRRMAGDSLVLTLAPDGAVTSAVGRGSVQLELPASDGSPARSVRAQALDAAGEPGRGLTSARFTTDVEFREETGAQGAARTARARALDVGFAGDAISHALFTGQVRFDEQGLRASAAEARYDPVKGVLRLRGSDAGGGPRVADERIAVEADALEVTLHPRRMVATGGVKTLLQGSDTTPGLLRKEQPANVSAARLEYAGDPVRAVYTGGAQLWQGDTAIRADRITIDQDKGTVLASGAARSTLSMDGAVSVGRAEEIRYEDAARQLTYQGIVPPLAVASKAPPSAAPPATAGAPASDPPAPLARVPAQLTGAQGDLRADRIVVVLAKTESRMERLEAYTNVALRLDTRQATGARLTFYGPDERYVISGAAAVPVKVVEPCRETSGKTITFFKSSDRIVVDGNEEIRTRTASGGPCPQAPASR